MASETGFSDEFQSYIQEFMNSSNRDIPLFFPFILGFNSTNPPQETQDRATQGESRDRVILINPLTQTMVIMASRGRLESLFAELFSRKNGQRLASKAAIDAMSRVEIVNGDEQCVVCLEEYEVSEMAKKMPCKHRFHGDCIEKWLNINGSCPVCRYEMPVDDDENSGRKNREENDGGRRRGILVSFSFGGGWRNRENFDVRIVILHQIIKKQRLRNIFVRFVF